MAVTEKALLNWLASAAAAGALTYFTTVMALGVPTRHALMAAIPAAIVAAASHLRGNPFAPPDAG